MLFCGLLVIDHAVGLVPDDLPDQDDWARMDAWIVCVDCVNTAKLMEAYAPGRVTNLLVEPDRGERYQKGLRAANHVADYALLLQPGTSINNLELPVLNRETDAVVLQYVGRQNQSRWRRMLVRCDKEWRFDDARAQWELIDGTPVDVMAKKASVRENPTSNYSVLQWSRQCQAQTGLLRNQPETEQLEYELALSHLRLNHPEKACECFQRLAENDANSKIHRCVAYTMLASLNSAETDIAKRIEMYERALRLWPNLAETYFFLAESRIEQGQVAEAMSVLMRCRDRPAGEITALDSTMLHTRLPRLLAQCHAELGNHAQAIHYYNQALHINDKYYFASSKQDSQAMMHQRRDELYLKAYPLPETHEPAQNHFKIIVAFWNASDFLADCVASIAQQDYSNYQVIFIDDVSTDGGLHNVDMSGLSKYHIVTQENRQGPLKNQVEAVLELCEEQDIVVVLDGDDRLADSGVLAYLDKVYSALDCWVTIGQFKVDDDWRWGYARPILPNEDISEVFARQTLRFPVHLRTHRAGLLHRLKELDPDLEAFRDKDNNFFFHASDVAYCRVIMSLAGAERIRYIPRILMDYNIANPLSVHQKNRDSQSRSCVEIARLAPLEKLASYYR